MEIYRNSNTAKVLLPAPPEVVPVDGTVDVKAVSVDGTTLYTFSQVSRTAAGFSVNLPWSLVREDGEFFVDWAFSYIENAAIVPVTYRTQIEIVTPIIPLADVGTISEFDDTDDIMNLERQVRYAIQTYTGQNFGRFRATLRLRGVGGNHLPLPYPLLQMDTVKAGLGVKPIEFGTIFVGSEGWSLTLDRQQYYGIKAAPPEEAIDMFLSTGVLRAPSIRRGYFHENAEYSVTGLWGFYDVPGDIQTAARMLIEDYSCDESLWRDRYVESIKAADWRIQLNKPGAWSGTGNVQADHILDTYRRMSMAVV